MKKMNESKSNQKRNSGKNKLTEKENNDFHFLQDNDVRTSIISCISVLKEPLNLSKLSKLTGYPITTLIHHIPQMLERNLIKTEKVVGKRGKYYNITEKYLKIRNIKSQEMDIEDEIRKLDERQNLSISEYKKETFNELKKNFESKKFTINIADVIRSLGVFNNNIAKISSEYVKYIINHISDENPENLLIPLADIFLGAISLSFSNVNQLIEFKKIYINFVQNLYEFRGKLEKENGKFDEKGLEKAYIYFFTTPIINITEI